MTTEDESRELYEQLLLKHWDRARTLFERWRVKDEAARELKMTFVSAGWGDSPLRPPERAWYSGAEKKIAEMEGAANLQWAAYFDQLKVIRDFADRSGYAP